LISKYKMIFPFSLPLKAVCVLAIAECHCKRKGGVSVGWILFYLFIYLFICSRQHFFQLFFSCSRAQHCETQLLR